MGKMNGEETHAAPVDRLTPLPDPIIHHILSFLDTKSSVKTSVLSRPWKSMWKHVPILDLDREDFSKSFRRLDTFLDKIFRHPEINLKTLILSSVWIEDNELGSFPGFSMVTSLNLHNCAFWFKLERDPFRRFPCLKDLVVHDYWGTVNNKLKVSGPELLSLELRPESNYCTKAQMIEIDAPKLESFTLDFRTYAKQLPCFGEMNIPSLVRVDLYPKFVQFEPKDLMPIIRQFQCVRSLAVNSHIIWDRDGENRLDFDNDGVDDEIIATRVHEVANLTKSVSNLISSKK